MFERLNAERLAGWQGLEEVLTASLADPRIARSPDASALVHLIIELVSAADSETTVREALGSLESFFASMRAKEQHAPNTKAMRWVLEQWSAEQEGLDRNKSAFARRYVIRLREELGITVDERTIRERWLKGR